jgi:hypothetical protein
MPQVIERYKVVRRGPKYCVRIKGIINTTDSWHWCRERNMSYCNIKQYWTMHKFREVDWDYDLIFDKDYEATAFILGYL